MPSVLGSGFTKAMGPLMTAGGLIGAPFTGGMTLPLAMGGLQQMVGPGGVMGPSATPPTMPSIAAPAMSAAPMSSPEMPSPAGAGLTPNVPGPGATAAQGAGTAGNLGMDIASNLLGPANPFAQYATAA